MMHSNYIKREIESKQNCCKKEWDYKADGTHSYSLNWFAFILQNSEVKKKWICLLLKKDTIFI